MEKIFSNIKINNYQEERLDISLSAFEVFKRLYPYCKNIFLLESLGEEGKYNRFSYIGFDSEFMILAKKNQMIVKGRCSYVINPYTTLASHFKSKSNGDNFCGGLVGYVSYE